jgi:hypothetical protein
MSGEEGQWGGDNGVHEGGGLTARYRLVNHLYEEMNLTLFFIIILVQVLWMSMRGPRFWGRNRPLPRCGLNPQREHKMYVKYVSYDYSLVFI